MRGIDPPVDPGADPGQLETPYPLHCPWNVYVSNISIVGGGVFKDKALREQCIVRPSGLCQRLNPIKALYKLLRFQMV